jgi:hypothetical protein
VQRTGKDRVFFLETAIKAALESCVLTSFVPNARMLFSSNDENNQMALFSGVHIKFLAKESAVR